MRPVGIVAAVVLGVVAAALVLQVIISYVPLVRKARANAPVPALATPGAGGAIGGVQKKVVEPRLHILEAAEGQR